MGANVAPTYANLTMGFWEAKYIWRNNHLSAHIDFYGRYIDDVVIIWEGTDTDINNFVSYCKSNLFGLSFTTVYNNQSLAFLDLPEPWKAKHKQTS